MANVRAISSAGAAKTAHSKISPKDKSSSLATPTDIDASDVVKIADAVNRVVADTFILYMKTKNFHWHMNGKHFRDYHLMLDEQAAAVYATIDPLAERVRKLGAPTVHSFAEIIKLSSLKEDEAAYRTPAQMFDALIADNKAAIKSMRQAHSVCDEAEDIATASLLEQYVDEAERRLWFLFETNQDREDSAT